MRCVIYARYSTDRQTESSIDDQLRVCREFAAARAWQIVGEYVDRGISGAAAGNRPDYQRALAAVGAGDVLLANDTYRIARSQDFAPAVTRLRFRGIRVIGVQDGFDSEAETAGMQAGMSGIMSEELRKYVARRVHSALSQRARDGRPTGGKAFGDLDLVREIFRRFADGESMLAIVSDLNRRGVPSPGAAWKERSRPRGKWQMSTLHAVLKNEVYIGRVIWNRSQWVKDPDAGTRHRRERPREEWIVRECEPVIDMATWERAQARFVRKRGRGGGVPSYLLSGLLVCGVCAGKMIVVGGSQRRYVCGTRHGGGQHACSNNLGVPRLLAEQYLLEPVERDLLSPEAEAEGVRQMRAARTEAEKTPPAQDRDLLELERLVREGILSAEIAAPSLEAARRRAAVRRAAPVDGLPWPTVAAWREAVRAMRETLRGPDVNAARSVLRELVGEVRCVPEGQFMVAEMASQKVLMATGTGIGIWNGSGGPLRIHIPTSTRRPLGVK